MNDTYDEFSELLGAYALDAVDPDERERIELHLAECPRCRAEVSEHREVASYLSQAGATAPEGVWDRISAELSPAAPPMRMAIISPEVPAPGAPTSVVAPSGTAPAEGSTDTVTAIGAGRRPSRPMWAVVSIAAAIIALLGVVAIGQARHLNQGTSTEQLASDLMADSKLKVELTGDDGTGRAVVGPDGTGYLIMDEVPAPPDGDVYQLWGKVDGTVLSLGTFGDSAVVPFSVDPDRVDDIELFAVTQEKAPGVVASQQDPVMVGTV